MKESNKVEQKISRRRILPLLGGGFLIPLLGFDKIQNKTEDNISNDDDYQILLRSDGTTVKVKTSTIKQSKSVKKNLSNNSFYSWLKNKI